MHKELRDKRERRAAMNVAKPSITVVAAQNNQKTISAENTKKMEEQEDEKKERRVIKMVILNGLLNLILRSPDILFWMENSNNWVWLFKSVLALRSIIFFMPGFLSFIVDIGYFSYILTFTTNYIVFYFFNSKFKEAVVFFSTSNAKRN
jgi:K+-sensing histidine kinase KdpD